MSEEELDAGASTACFTSRAYTGSIEKECRMDGDKIQPPNVIQNLVQAWKVLWRWRKH